MEVSAIEPTRVVPKRRLNRMAVIVALGVVAIIVSLVVRNSTWTREKRLENLNLEELALAIHDSPNDSLTFLYYGSALLKAENLEGSERAFQRAVELDKKSARAYVGLGSAQIRAGNRDRALASFEQALKLEPKNTMALLGLAQTHYQSGSPRRALPSLKRITELEPKNAIAWYQLGKTYGDNRQSDLALEALKRAVALDPKQADFWRDLGQLHRHYSQNNEAEEAFKETIRLQRGDAHAYLLLGQLYADTGTTPRLRGLAEQCFVSAIVRDPALVEAYNELGLLYERARNFKAAVPRYRKAVELDPSYDKPLYHLGYCLIQTGQKAEGEKLMKASQELRKAQFEINNTENRLRADPSNRPLNLRLARLYRRYGNFEGALQQYDRYQRLGPKEPAIDKEAVAYIAELQKQGLLPGSKPADPIKPSNSK